MQCGPEILMVSEMQLNLYSNRHYESSDVILTLHASKHTLTCLRREIDVRNLEIL